MNVYFVLNNKLRSLTNLSLEHWLWWVIQAPTSLVFYTNYRLSPTGCCLLNTKNDFEMRRIVKTSVMLTIFAHRRIVPTIHSPMQMDSECRICACLPNVNRILNDQLWSMTNPSLEHWLWWVAQVPTSLVFHTNYSRVFYTNYSISITGSCLLKTENDHEMRWIVEVSIWPMFFAQRRIAATNSSSQDRYLYF